MAKADQDEGGAAPVRSARNIGGAGSVRAARNIGGAASVRAARNTGGAPPELAELRHSIDNIDAAVLHLLAERFKCTRKVGALKARLGLPPADPAREGRQIARLRALAVEADLDPEFAEKFLAFLVREVIRHHEILRGAAR
ncbi:MAG: chorismate mutase [Caulobacteraceae bacterium]